MPGNNNEIEKWLWAAADQLWANSNLKPSEFSNPVLGLIFLRYADHKFTDAQAKLSKSSVGGGRRKIGKLDYQAMGVLYLPEEARFSNLQNLPEGADLAKAVKGHRDGERRAKRRPSQDLQAPRKLHSH
jgi:type I restriction enzyme M protein